MAVVSRRGLSAWLLGSAAVVGTSTRPFAQQVTPAAGAPSLAPRSGSSTFYESRMLGDLVATEEMRDVFDERRMVDHWIRAWAAMAEAQGEHGIVRQEAAQKIAASLKDFHIEPAEMRAEVRQVGRGIAPALRRVRERVGQELANSVHVGSTTQDILDTGLALQLKDGLDLIERDAKVVVEALIALARAHKTTVMAGRTNSLQAAPITFGFKVACWLSEITRAIERLRQARARVLAIQLGGAVGTFDSMGPKGIEARASMARILGLRVHSTGWSTQRDNVAECLFAVGLLVSALGHIAIETGVLVRSEIDEIREGGAPGRGVSTAMPQKSNPRSTEFLEGLARIVQGRAAGLYSMLWQPNERHGGVWIAEWPLAAEHFMACSGALLHARELITGMFVHVEQMRANLDLDGGAVMSAAYAKALTIPLGRTQADAAVKAAVERARKERRPLATVIAETPELGGKIAPEDLKRLLDPANHVGLSSQIVDLAIKDAETLWR